MIKNLVLAAVLTVSAFAATQAQAATGQTGFVSGGGSYEFTKTCKLYGIPSTTALCRDFCFSIGYPEGTTRFATCVQSYRDNKQTSKGPKQHFEQGFVQGKFRSR